MIYDRLEKAIKQKREEVRNNTGTINKLENRNEDLKNEIDTLTDSFKVLKRDEILEKKGWND
jgi:predicted RNase H-like nuclease (RuvC/YqgF family)